MNDNTPLIYHFEKREIHLPEPFKTEIACYFEPSKGESLDWSRVDDLKKELVVLALKTCKGNQTHAAKLLGVTRSGIFELRKQYGL